MYMYWWQCNIDTAIQLFLFPERTNKPANTTSDNTCKLAYDGPLHAILLAMTDDMLGPSPMRIKYVSYVYDILCIWRTNFYGSIESVICKFACIYILETETLNSDKNLVKHFSRSLFLPEIMITSHDNTTFVIGGWPRVRIILLMAFFVTSRHPCLFIST